MKAIINNGNNAEHTTQSNEVNCNYIIWLSFNWFSSLILLSLVITERVNYSKTIKQIIHIAVRVVWEK